MSAKRLIAILLVLAFPACSQATDLPQASDLSGCAVRVLQDGKAIAGTGAAAEPPVYEVRPAPFKIEVMPLSCKPGLALEIREVVDYLRATPLVFSGGGYWRAGDLASANTLAVAAIGSNPRTSLDEEIRLQTRDVAWAKGIYDEACRSLGYCPQVAKTYRTAWPFLDPTSLENRGVAEFTLFDKFRPMSAAKGREIFAIVYTVEKEFSKGPYDSPFHILKPNVLRLKFSDQ